MKTVLRITGSNESKVSKKLFFAFYVNAKFQETKNNMYSWPSVSVVSRPWLQPKAVGLLLVESVDAKPEDTECQLHSFHGAVCVRSVGSWAFGLHGDS